MEELPTVPGSRVTTVSRGAAGFALLATDRAGGIYATAGRPGTSWWGWGSVSEGKTTPGAPITAVPWRNHVAVFVADPGGGVFTAAGDPQTGWGPWGSVSQGQTTPGAPVTVVPWGNGFAVFIADPGGQVFTAVGDPNGFGPWGSCSAPHQTIPGAPVTAVPWGNHIALLMASPTGEVIASVGDPQKGFPRWSTVSQGATKPGALVTALPWGQRIAVFIADPGGGIFTNASVGQGWGSWASVSGGQSTPGAPVTAVPWKNGFALFVSNPGGEVFSTEGDPQTGFKRWLTVSQGRTMPGAPVTAALSGDVGVFVADPGGGIFAAEGSPDAGYGPWKPVAQFAPAPAAFQLGVLPPEPTPAIPEGDDIILYLHGGPGSRLEEASDLVGQLHAEGLKLNPPKRYAVIVFDQPSQGYSSMLDPDQIVPSHDVIGDHYPTLLFSEDFIAAFVNALDKIVPITHRNIFIIGGSTGGGLALRMGSREYRGHSSETWLKGIVAWSAASVWRTYAHDVIRGVALNTGFGRAKESEYYEINTGPFERPILYSRRPDFFDQAFGGITIPSIGDGPIVGPGFIQPNPEEWYRGDRDAYYPTVNPAKEWPCKWDYIAGTRLDYEEVYNPAFRRWHWRMGTEELLFSFFNNDWEGPASDPNDSPPTASVYTTITKPLLLVAAEDDDWDEGPNNHFENRYSRTIDLANALVQWAPTTARGKTLLLPNTGHSIHNERPILFARQIVEFLSTIDQYAKGPFQALPVFPLGFLLEEDQNCLKRPSQLSQYPRPPRELLENPDSAAMLIQPARLGGTFSDGGSPGKYGLRLIQALRDVAAKKDPLVAMGNAAARYYRGDPTWAAFADLAVTGREAYDALRNHPPTDLAINDMAFGILVAAGITAPVANRLADAILSAKTRAYKVAWVLRDPDRAEGVRLRPAWGWIAVSGEDDPPARPVNVSSGLPIYGADTVTQVSAHPQFELGVSVTPDPENPKYYPVSFQIRYTIASPPIIRTKGLNVGNISRRSAGW